MSFVVISTRLQQKMFVLMKQLKIVKEIQYEEKRSNNGQWCGNLPSYVNIWNFVAKNSRKVIHKRTKVIELNDGLLGDTNRFQ